MNMNNTIHRLVRTQHHPITGRAARALLNWRGTDIATSHIAPGLRLPHAATGVVIHAHTQIGKNVTIFQHVTIGRADMTTPPDTIPFEGVIIEDEVVLSAGAVVLNRGGCPPLVVGRGTVVGANAVLLCSTGPGEVWAGVPAVRVGVRDGWPDRRHAAARV